MSQVIQKSFLEIIIFVVVFCFIALTNHTELVLDDTSLCIPTRETCSLTSISVEQQQVSVDQLLMLC